MKGSQTFLHVNAQFKCKIYQTKIIRRDKFVGEPIRQGQFCGKIYNFDLIVLL